MGKTGTVLENHVSGPAASSVLMLCLTKLFRGGETCQVSLHNCHLRSNIDISRPDGIWQNLERDKFHRHFIFCSSGARISFVFLNPMKLHIPEQDRSSQVGDDCTVWSPTVCPLLTANRDTGKRVWTQVFIPLLTSAMCSVGQSKWFPKNGKCKKKVISRNEFPFLRESYRCITHHIPIAFMPRSSVVCGGTAATHVSIAGQQARVETAEVKWTLFFCCFTLFMAAWHCYNFFNSFCLSVRYQLLPTTGSFGRPDVLSWWERLWIDPECLRFVLLEVLCRMSAISSLHQTLTV